MDIHTLYIIAYATSTTSSLGSCAILLFLNYGNIETNPVYLKARRILALRPSSWPSVSSSRLPPENGNPSDGISPRFPSP